LVNEGYSVQRHRVQKQQQQLLLPKVQDPRGGAWQLQFSPSWLVVQSVELNFCRLVPEQRTQQQTVPDTITHSSITVTIVTSLPLSLRMVNPYNLESRWVEGAGVGAGAQVQVLV
jgi:hypothetical protein